VIIREGGGPIEPATAAVNHFDICTDLKHVFTKDILIVINRRTGSRDMSASNGRILEIGNTQYQCPGVDPRPIFVILVSKSVCLLINVCDGSEKTQCVEEEKYFSPFTGPRT
jgi:hypothetical protein